MRSARQPFTSLTAVAVPLLRSNVDTDAIIPSREIKSVGKRGLASGLFAGWRYLDGRAREPDPSFVFNEPRFAGAQILLTGHNFGCGSSREHAVWALQEYGIRCIAAAGFAPIFFANCIANGVLAAILDEAAIATLAACIETAPQEEPLTIDLRSQRVSLRSGVCFEFTIDGDSRSALLSGDDAIAQTLRAHESIDAFLTRDRKLRPWVYLEPSR